MSNGLLTPYWTELFYHELQCRAFRSKTRFVNLACGRRSGKTDIARRKTISSLPVKKPWPDPRYLYCLPTYAQAKRVAWKPLLNLIPKHWIKEKYVMDLTIETKFGSELIIAGLDQPQRIEGVPYDGVVIDESCDQKPKVFDLSIRPALSDRIGWCWRIGVPKRYGVGSAEYKSWYDRGVPGPNKDPDIDSYTWPSSDILPDSEVDSAKRVMDEKDFREQYEASWETAGGGIYHAFDGRYNVSEKAEYCPELPVCVAMDFNVDPMAWILGHIIHPEDEDKKFLFIFDEIYVHNTNTPECLEYLSKLHPKSSHKSGFHFYGDATSRARKTAASTTDYLHIASDTRFDPKKIFIPRSNPPILDRFSAVNAALRSADGVTKILIHPRCKNLIRDLETRSFIEGTNIPDDTDPEAGHITDAFGYIVFKEFPPLLIRPEGQPIITSIF